jgi:hypothetical protein
MEQVPGEASPGHVLQNEFCKSNLSVCGPAVNPAGEVARHK